MWPNVFEKNSQEEPVNFKTELQNVEVKLECKDDENVEASRRG